jgi:hypothetical protein
MMKQLLELTPITLKDANAFVNKHHRHHKGVTCHRFAVSLIKGKRLVGVAIAGNPVARKLCDGRTIEVVRTCTVGAKNANSMLYGAIWRAARALGYVRMITYTMPEESGSSLRAVGMIEDGMTDGDSWDRPGRHRKAGRYPVGPKIRWVLWASGYPVTDRVKEKAAAA